MKDKLTKVILSFILVSVLMQLIGLNMMNAEAAEVNEINTGTVSVSSPIFKWADNFESCTAYFKNEMNSEEVKELKCTTSMKKDNQSVIYSSTVVKDGEKYEDSIIVWNIPSGTNEGLDIRIVIRRGYRNIEDSLKNMGFDSEEKIKDAMFKVTGLQEESNFKENRITVGSKLYDVEFQLSFDSGVNWVNATEENFPKNGLTITMPYPEGVNKDTNNFIVTHMFTHDLNGQMTGEIEKTAVIKTDNALQFTVKSLSPILIAWYDAISSMDSKKTESQTARKDNIVEATISQDDTTNKKIVWSSSDEKVAVVDEDGNVTAVGDGTCVITATTEAGEKVSSCNVTVNDSQFGAVNKSQTIKTGDVFNWILLSVVLIASMAIIGKIVFLDKNKIEEIEY